MNKIVRKQTALLYNQKGVRKYEFTMDGLIKFSEIKPRSQQLLIDLLAFVGHNCSVGDVIIQVTYKDLAFTSFANFSKYRQELIDSRLLFYKDNVYFINPCYINYYTRRQKEYFLKLFKLKKEIPVTMTDPKLFKIV